jgi:hypothetical protein
VGHAHSGTDITSGTVADARIAATLARDSEIMPTVFANDGSGSGLDADTLDGLSSASFARPSRTAQAYGGVNQYSDTLDSGSFNVTSLAWNEDLDRYEITITGMSFSIDDVAFVTTKGDGGSCPAGTIPRVGSVSGMLLVYHLNSAGTKVKCSFNFVVFAGT